MDGLQMACCPTPACASGMPHCAANPAGSALAHADLVAALQTGACNRLRSRRSCLQTQATRQLTSRTPPSCRQGGTTARADGEQPPLLATKRETIPTIQPPDNVSSPHHPRPRRCHPRPPRPPPARCPRRRCPAAAPRAANTGRHRAAGLAGPASGWQAPLQRTAHHLQEQLQQYAPHSTAQRSAAQRSTPHAQQGPTCTSARSSSGLSVSAAMMRGSMPRSTEGPAGQGRAQRKVDVEAGQAARRRPCGRRSFEHSCRSNPSVCCRSTPSGCTDRHVVSNPAQLTFFEPLLVAAHNLADVAARCWLAFRAPQLRRRGRKQLCCCCRGAPPHNC